MPQHGFRLLHTSSVTLKRPLKSLDNAFTALVRYDCMQQAVAVVAAPSGHDWRSSQTPARDPCSTWPRSLTNTALLFAMSIPAPHPSVPLPETLLAPLGQPAGLLL